MQDREQRWNGVTYVTGHPLHTIIGKPIKIGLSGKMASGKTTIARHLVETWGFAEYSFAARLKEIAQDLFGCYGKDRKLYQALGIKMREIDERVWADYVLRQIPEGRDIVISDVRFFNEAALLRKRGFILIRLGVSPQVQLDRLTQAYPNMDMELRFHPSETDLDFLTDTLFDYQACTDNDPEKTLRVINRIICIEKGLIDGKI